MIQDLEKIFKAAADHKIALKQSAYMRDQFSYLGLTKPRREILEKELFKQTKVQNLAELQKILLDLWKKEPREFQYTALCFAQKHRKMMTPEILPALETMIRSKSWWDTVDTIAPNFVGYLVKIHPELKGVMDQWIEDPYLWIRRAALLHQLRWKEKTDEEKLFGYCQKTMHEKDFFIRKAIGWVLREYSKTNPKAVKKFISLHQSRMSNLSIREGSKYLR